MTKDIYGFAKILREAQADAEAFGAGFLRILPDGSAERLSPESVLIRTSHDNHACELHMAMDRTCMECGRKIPE